MDNFGTSERLRRALTLKTGQTTSYANNDDGQLQKGEPHRYYVLSTGQYSGTTNITLNAKTESHSNECVLDEATGLMWSRTASLSVGPTSNGFLPWTTNGSGEGIFTYLAAANTASLAGYTDWRIPNKFELFTQDAGEFGLYVDSTVFPTITTIAIWSSSTAKNLTTNGLAYQPISGTLVVSAKTATILVWLVRGPV